MELNLVLPAGTVQSKPEVLTMFRKDDAILRLQRFTHLGKLIGSGFDDGVVTYLKALFNFRHFDTAIPVTRFSGSEITNAAYSRALAEAKSGKNPIDLNSSNDQILQRSQIQIALVNFALSELFGVKFKDPIFAVREPSPFSVSNLFRRIIHLGYRIEATTAVINAFLEEMKPLKSAFGKQFNAKKFVDALSGVVRKRQLNVVFDKSMLPWASTSWRHVDTALVLYKRQIPAQEDYKGKQEIFNKMADSLMNELAFVEYVSSVTNAGMNGNFMSKDSWESATLILERYRSALQLAEQTGVVERVSSDESHLWTSQMEEPVSDLMGRVYDNPRSVRFVAAPELSAFHFPVFNIPTSIVLSAKDGQSVHNYTLTRDTTHENAINTAFTSLNAILNPKSIAYDLASFFKVNTQPSTRVNLEKGDGLSKMFANLAILSSVDDISFKNGKVYYTITPRFNIPKADTFRHKTFDTTDIGEVISYCLDHKPSSGHITGIDLKAFDVIADGSTLLMAEDDKTPLDPWKAPTRGDTVELVIPGSEDLRVPINVFKFGGLDYVQTKWVKPLAVPQLNIADTAWSDLLGEYFPKAAAASPVAWDAFRLELVRKMSGLSSYHFLNAINAAGWQWNDAIGKFDVVDHAQLTISSFLYGMYHYAVFLPKTAHTIVKLVQTDGQLDLTDLLITNQIRFNA